MSLLFFDIRYGIYKDERFIVVRNGEVVATIEPTKEPKQSLTVRELLERLAENPPDTDFAKDVEEGIANQTEPYIPEWPS